MVGFKMAKKLVDQVRASFKWGAVMEWGRLCRRLTFRIPRYGPARLSSQYLMFMLDQEVKSTEILPLGSSCIIIYSSGEGR